MVDSPLLGFFSLIFDFFDSLIFDSFSKYTFVEFISACFTEYDIPPVSVGEFALFVLTIVFGVFLLVLFCKVFVSFIKLLIV